MSVVVLSFEALLIEPFLDRMRFVVGLENQVVPIRTAERDIDMTTMLFLLDGAAQAREDGHKLLGLFGVIDVHPVSTRHPVMHGDCALCGRFIVTMHRFKPSGLQPLLPLVGEFVGIERDLRPLGGTELDINMASVLIRLSFTAELLQRTHLLLGFVGVVEVQGLPLRESKRDRLGLVLRLGSGCTLNSAPATGRVAVLCVGDGRCTNQA